jgi:hypothetical protein
MAGVSRSGKTFTAKQGQYLAYIYLYYGGQAAALLSVDRAGQDDQGDRARAACVAEHGAQGDSLRDDGFRV